MEEALLIKDQLMKMTGIPSDLITVEMFTDCNDLVSAVYSSKANVSPTSRAQIHVAKIREALEHKEVKEVKWLPTDMMLADGLTKKSDKRFKNLELLIQTFKTGQFAV